MASLLYGAGLRLRECLTLRVKDVDFDYRQIVVREGKGAKDRRTLLPGVVVEPLKAHLLRVKALHEKDLANGYGDVELPHALDVKYPRAGERLRHPHGAGAARTFERGDHAYTHVMNKGGRGVHSPLDRIVAHRQALRTWRPD
jgi:integrase